jgi:ribosomal silencing factor RsfS
VVDAFDFMIHIQTEEMRDLYRLDYLWRDSVEVEL